MRKYKILLVDDEISVINSIKRVLDNLNYNIYSTTYPEQAYDLLDTHKFDLVISDQRMPKVSGIDILKYSKKVSHNTVTILITGYADLDVVISAINEGSIYRYISKPWQNDDLVKIIEESIDYKQRMDQKDTALNLLLSKNKEYENIVHQLRNKLSKTNRQVKNTLLRIMQARDMKLFTHSKNVACYSLYIADLLNLSNKQKLTLQYAGLFHDIGKIAIRDKILFKPGKLSEEEYTEMKYHPLISSYILNEIDFMKEVVEVVLQHHERIDGLGYPLGLTGDEILFESKILSVADAYDAMISDRNYRKEMSQKKVLEILQNGIGKQFDENIVNTFIEGLLNEKKFPLCKIGYL
ncbi:HD domain-containing phosphohydrolase [Tepidibacillus sp. LV47]|uniref:HD domain-containing phosphohydrolase n=1 Tax=Tepidibacillus sp. LV47 TaxID=3398228 RepID=UPI003AAA6C37